MDIKTRLTRCCGKPVGGYKCSDGIRCPDCFDKLEALREIEQLQLALGAMVSAYDHDWEANDAVVRCRKIMANGYKPWDEIERLKEKVEEQKKNISRYIDALRKIDKLIPSDATWPLDALIAGDIAEAAIDGKAVEPWE